MPRLSFALDPDVFAAIETYRATTCPDASLAQAAQELIRVGLGRAPDTAVFDVERAAARSAEVKRVNERMSLFFRDLAEESARRG